MAGGIGNAAEVFDGDRERGRVGRGGEFRGQGLRRGGELGDEPRGAGLDALDLLCIAEVNFGCGGEQAGGDGVGKIPVKLGGGVGHAGFALHFGRQQGMGGAPGRPGVFGCAEEPDSIGSESGGLGGASDLDGRVARFGGKEGLFEAAGENGEEILPVDAATVEAERAGGFKGLLPAANGLEFGA